jgi:hypothetical protein
MRPTMGLAMGFGTRAGATRCHYLCHSATLPLCHFATMPLSATLPLFDNRRCCLAHPHVENKCDWAGVRGVPAPAHQHTSTVVACCARCSTLPLPQ